MSSTEVRPKGGPAQGAVQPLVDCTPLFSLAAGAAGVRVRRASGAAGGGDPRAAGGSCTPAAGVVARRPEPPVSRTTELHPRLSLRAAARRLHPAPIATDTVRPCEAGQEASEK